MSYHKYTLLGRSTLLTEGFFQTIKENEAFWLVDLVLSHQIKPKVKNEPFQVWKLKKVDGVHFKISSNDGGKNGEDRKVLSMQDIPFSDFKRSEFEFYYIDNVLLLKSEY